MFKHLLGWVLLAGAAASSAAPIPITLHGGPTDFTASVGSSKQVAGHFVDEYLFDFQGRAHVSGQVSSTFRVSRQQVNQISFLDVDLDGIDFAADSMTTGSGSAAKITNFRLLPVAATAGSFVLHVEGCVVVCDASSLPAGTPITASYSGTINVLRVPEPASGALALAALASAGLAMRRRAVPRSPR